ncbi:MAG: hypothetical protein A2Z03_04130 [Chloroflexi bacterium RBG_16_56_8]|nr:MAG: hypothetical protein A2Z03_04130 [Chloroflexi bacterium RBG_16_56_8]
MSDLIVIAEPGEDLGALYDEWSAAEDPNDPIWIVRWGNAAIANDLPFYAGGQTDHGAAGWRQWLADSLQSSNAFEAPSNAFEDIPIEEVPTLAPARFMRRVVSILSGLT